MSNDLWASTLKENAENPASARTAVPAATIVCHPQLARIGERSLLKGLMVMKPVEISRTHTEFHQPHSQLGRPLEDPFVSRTPVTVSSLGDGGFKITASTDQVVVDGEALQGTRQVTRDQVQAGVVIEMAARVGILLHHVHTRAPIEVPGLVGHSDGLEDVRLEIKRVADLDVPVLIRGETGSGKEMVAQAIHAMSKRHSGQCVAVNMAAVPESTAVSMLFGHAKGAFTGAAKRHVGLFERADGGTLFLDEIGEVPDAVQPMLLRAVETGLVLPMGDEQERKVDVRIVAATDANLEQDVEKGSFRAALLHRLAGYSIRLPPLRERPDDVARLFLHFMIQELERVGLSHWLQADMANPAPRVLSSLVTRLIKAPWHGNVRQLQNVVRHLVISNRGNDQLAMEPSVLELLGEAAPAPAHSGAPMSPESNPSRPTDISDLALLSALEENRWAPGRTATCLGIPTSTLHDLMKRCPSIRKAKDIPEAELRDAMDICAGEVRAMAERLRVSERALKLTLKERDLT